MTVELNQDTLGRLPAGISVPRYDRGAVSPGVLHIGVGNFHRAHQAIYLDRLFNTGIDLDWGIVGAGIRPTDAKMRENLRRQDWLTTVVELEPRGHRATICGSMVDFLPVSPPAIVNALSRPEFRIVSLTITEGGYFVDGRTGGFRADHPDIRHDMERPNEPRTVFGILLASLLRRRDLGLTPFTVVSCDNIEKNGDVARQALLALAEAMSPSTADWIASTTTFPNTMVDCITPNDGPRIRGIVAEEIGILDCAPVVCEPFRQWIIEDRFTAGRPALEDVGVDFVEDVGPYEQMKLRILNGGHAILGYSGALLGHRFVHEAMGDGLIRAYLERLERQEIIPTLAPIRGIDFHAYLASVLERFSNPGIGDTIERLCFDGSNRQPKFILPTISDRLKSQCSVDGLALEIALWCRYCAGQRDDGSRIDLNDENKDRLRQHALQAESDPAAFLDLTDIFGSVRGNEIFTTAFARAHESLRRDGTAATLRTYLNGGLHDRV